MPLAKVPGNHWVAILQVDVRHVLAEETPELGRHRLDTARVESKNTLLVVGRPLVVYFETPMSLDEGLQDPLDLDIVAYFIRIGIELDHFCRKVSIEPVCSAKVNRFDVREEAHSMLYS
jgi:hypothetical protein